MSSLLKKYKSFKKGQEGNASIEFVLLFPAFMILFFMGFESGYYMVRGVMLERAVDIAVRDVRLANGAVPDLEDLKTNVCNVATILPDCEASLQIEIRPVAPVPGGVAAAGTETRCIDKRAEVNDPENDTIYDTGSGNQLMLVRVCALASPMFPSTGIGAGLRYDNFGNYALVATSAFVNEPADSTDRDPVGNVAAPSNGNSGGANNGNNGFGNGDQDAPGNSLNNNNAENDQTPGGNGNSSNAGNSGNNSNTNNSSNAGDGGDDTGDTGNSNAGNSQNNNSGGNGNNNAGGNGSISNDDDSDDDDDGTDDDDSGAVNP